MRLHVAAAMVFVGAVAEAGAAEFDHLKGLPEPVYRYIVDAANAVYMIEPKGSNGFALEPTSTAPPIFYGEGDTQYEKGKCQWYAAFKMNQSGGSLGQISTWHCRDGEAIAALARRSIERAPAEWKKLGGAPVPPGFVSRESMPGGGETLFHPVLFAGHGLVIAPTLTILDGPTKSAVVVQFSPDLVCRLRPKSPFCTDTVGSLKRIAATMRSVKTGIVADKK